MFAGVEEGGRLARAIASHWSVAHLVANAGALLVLGAAIAWREGCKVLVILLTISFVSQVATLAWLSDATEYRGLSGIACALAAFALVRSVGPRWTVVLVTAWWATRTTSSVLPHGVLPDPAMHAAGFATGLLAAMASRQADVGGATQLSQCPQRSKDGASSKYSSSSIQRHSAECA